MGDVWTLDDMAAIGKRVLAALGSGWTQGPLPASLLLAEDAYDGLWFERDDVSLCVDPIDGSYHGHSERLGLGFDGPIFDAPADFDDIVAEAVRQAHDMWVRERLDDARPLRLRIARDCHDADTHPVDLLAVALDRLAEQGGAEIFQLRREVVELRRRVTELLEKTDRTAYDAGYRHGYANGFEDGDSLDLWLAEGQTGATDGLPAAVGEDDDDDDDGDDPLCGMCDRHPGDCDCFEGPTLPTAVEQPADHDPDERWGCDCGAFYSFDCTCDDEDDVCICHVPGGGRELCTAHPESGGP